MKFGTFPVFKALGVKLAFPISCRGKVLPEGYELTASDLALLRYEEISEVTGWIPENTDLDPDTAMSMLLKGLAGEFVRYLNPHNGYSELYADVDGVFFASPERLVRFNSHNENVTLATIAPYTPVYKNQLIGSLRVLTPVIDATAVDEVLTKIAGLGAVLKIKPYAFRKLAYISTKLPVDGEFSVSPVNEKVQTKLTSCGFNFSSYACCPHTVPAIEKEVRNALEAGAEIILTASEVAPKHHADIVPAAFKESAADIDRLGLPFDPILNVVFAHKKNVTLLGAKESDLLTPAFDRVLRFLTTNTLPEPALLPAMATNSVDLQRSIQFITPEQQADSVAVAADNASDKIAVVILAAGASRRMLGRNKLLQSVFGLPMIENVVRSALSSKADYVYAVTGYQAEALERRLKNYDVKTVYNPDFASGVLSSARLGLSVLPPDVAGALVLPADMPGFTEKYIDALIDAFDPQHNKKICIPVMNRVRHNPVLWAKQLFPSFKIVPEDAHLSPVLIEHTDYMVEVNVDDERALADINTQGDLALFCGSADEAVAAEMDLEALSATLAPKNKPVAGN